MSGRKRSDYEIEAARAKELERQRRRAALRTTKTGLQERIQSMLSQASAGLQATFEHQVESAGDWLRQMRSEPDRLSEDVSESVLSQQAETGRSHLTALAIAFTETASELGRSLARELANVESQLVGCRELLENWFGATAVAQWTDSLADANQRLRREEFTGLREALQDIRRGINLQVEEATRWEKRHQERLYLLKALRQVCAEMGFQEVGEWRYEDPVQRGSRIRFEVDTLDRGRIVFSLSLDGIESDSGMFDRHCFEQFDQLSQAIEDEFGIQTEFKSTEGKVPPKLLKKGERDAPHAKGRRAEPPRP